MIIELQYLHQSLYIKLIDSFIFYLRILDFKSDSHAPYLPNNNIPFLQKVIKNRKVHEGGATKAMSQIKCHLLISPPFQKVCGTDLSIINLDLLFCKIVLISGLLKNKRFHLVDYILLFLSIRVANSKSFIRFQIFEL